MGNGSSYDKALAALQPRLRKVYDYEQKVGRTQDGLRTVVTGADGLLYPVPERSSDVRGALASADHGSRLADSIERIKEHPGSVSGLNLVRMGTIDKGPLLQIGLERAPFYQTVNHVLNEIHDKPGPRDAGSMSFGNWHGLTSGELAQVPELVARPWAVIESHPGSASGALIVCLELVDRDGYPVVAAIRPNTEIKDGRSRQFAHLLASVYPKDRMPDSMARYVKSAFLNDCVAYFDKARAERFAAFAGMELPARALKNGDLLRKSELAMTNLELNGGRAAARDAQGRRRGGGGAMGAAETARKGAQKGPGARDAKTNGPREPRKQPRRRPRTEP